MFTEAVDNFVDNLGLLAGGRRAVLPPSELPSDWAKKLTRTQGVIPSTDRPKHP
jgi:hypothetical protein